MTKKLYYDDSHLYVFNAKIDDIIEKDGNFLVILDKTAFFPEGGGQDSDEGFIGNNAVYYVSEESGIIFHHLKSIDCLSIGSLVNCRLNKHIRFSRMQAHSGEHIVSGIAFELFGANNVGFHMDELLMTVDFDKNLSKEQLLQIEKTANEYIYANKNITAKTYSTADAASIEYRSKLDFSDSVRIVDIEDIDKCACCAPHCSSTGEIGIIKILSSVSHRGGVRITMICGIAAYEDYLSKHNQTLNIAAALCAKHSETDIAVERLLRQNSDLKSELLKLNKRYLDTIADIIEKSPLILEFFDEMSYDSMRELSNILVSKSQYGVILLSGNDILGYSYCINSEWLDMRCFVRDFNKNLNGRGGGRDNFAQGKVSSYYRNIKEYIENLRFSDYENA